MRHREFKHESESRHSSLFVLSFLCVFLCAAALGTLRLYGLYLEHRISETSARIERCKEESLVLTRRYSQLLSPARIYSYARGNLGMSNAENIKVVRIERKSVMLAEARLREDTVEKGGFIENLNPFVNRAHAKD
ncbi:MAG: hypothetical protein Q4D58_09935 [Synergistaceae bacterium]|nr:hypothetical protein [Synergistaceae bacterium]